MHPTCFPCQVIINTPVYPFSETSSVLGNMLTALPTPQRREGAAAAPPDLHGKVAHCHSTVSTSRSWLGGLLTANPPARQASYCADAQSQFARGTPIAALTPEGPSPAVPATALPFGRSCSFLLIGAPISMKYALSHDCVQGPCLASPPAQLTPTPGYLPPTSPLLEATCGTASAVSATCMATHKEQLPCQLACCHLSLAD